MHAGSQYNPARGLREAIFGIFGSKFFGSHSEETDMRYLTPVLFAIAATVLSTAPVHADLGDQLFKLLADDGAAGDQFGISVAISRDTAIVGERFDDDNGIDSGSAYLYDISDRSNPVQIAKILAADGAAGDNFGVSVAISGDIALVGAWKDDGAGGDSGSAYLFDISDPNNPDEIAKLLPDDGATDDWFGRHVAISGATAIVGAFGDDDNGDRSGSAYVFDIPTGNQITKLLPSDGAPTDFFGWGVAISNTIAVVGARENDDNGHDSGSAYLFDATTGQELFKMLPNDGVAEAQFGMSVAISGDIALIGAWKDDDNGTFSGSAYLFDVSDPTNPIQLFKLLPGDGAPNDEFGVSVAMSGDIALVGAWRDNDNGLESGSAYLFDISDPANPVQITKFLPDDGAPNDGFGLSVAIGGLPGNEVAIVGAFLDDDNGADSGSAYLFDAGAPGKCPWDIDGSGAVDVKDLLFLLGAWGPCPKKGACLADFDNSGDVGVKDLLFLLGAWGPCP